MRIRPVKNEQDYSASLDRIEELWGAEPGTPAGDELDVLLTLVKVYEDEHHSVPPPSPVEAIKFVMEQQGLKQADLVRFIGSRSKVSEVLNGKRPLTLSMIRALKEGLHIPADILIQEGSSFPEDGVDVEWSRFPVHEIVKRGLVSGYEPGSQAEEIMRDVATMASVTKIAEVAACLRQGARRSPKDDPFAVQTWILQVLIAAKAATSDDGILPSKINQDFLRRVAQLSVLGDGPLKAREYLATRGIKLIVVPHYRRTYLDGAVLLEDGKTPVIGLTLRYDRLDNFWFTLLHELAHYILGHVQEIEGSCIIDDLDMKSSLDEMEQAADSAANEALIPHDLWESHPAKDTARLADVLDLAMLADVHPSVVAGRVRYYQNNYRILARQVGHGEVRIMFAN
jgi:HTH-type transcriptional regulator/antitoxin HigA